MISFLFAWFNDRKHFKISYLGWLAIWISSCTSPSTQSHQFTSYWQVQPNRFWIGPEYWSNRIQDWRLNQGRLECVSDLPLRTVHLLTHSLSDRDQEFSMNIELGQWENLDGPVSWAGFLIGAGDLDLDYRARAQVHNATGNNGGLIAGIDGTGRLSWVDNEDSLRVLVQSDVRITDTTLPIVLKLCLLTYFQLSFF